MSPRIDIKAIRREQIIKAVRGLISAEGLEAVTISRIAREAGLSRGVVTYHFRDKRTILHDVLAAAIRDANQTAASLPATGALARDLAELTARVTELAKTGNDWWRIYAAFLAHAHRDPFYRTELAAVDERYRLALERILGDRSRATILLALMRGLATQAMVTATVSLESITAELTNVLQAWATRAGPPRERRAR
jgi:AcrR family transcriptional regulator